MNPMELPSAPSAPQSKYVHIVDEPAVPVKKVSLWDGFLHVLLFVSLYWSSSAFVGLWFQYINKWYPDKASASFYSAYLKDYVDTIIKWDMASLAIMFPIFMGLFLYLKKQELKFPDRHDFKLRRVFIYITLVVTFLITFGDLIYFLFSYLDGGLTTRVVLKSLVTFLVSGSIFTYYLLTVRGGK